MSFLNKLTGSFIVLASLTACLQTRDTQKEQDEKFVLKKQLNTLQTTSADSNARFQDLEDENRKLNGRLEAMESRLLLVAQKADKANANQDQKMKSDGDLYKEEFTKLGAEIATLKAQLASIQDESRRASEARAAAEAAAAVRNAESAKNPYAAAEEKFEKKQWKDAILDYEKYRSANAKGKNVSSATYKIGLCFQELNMHEEAKSFFEEVVAKYPKSKDAGKAEARLKSMSGKKKSKS